MQITVHSLTGKQNLLSVELSTSIEDIKTTIKEKEGIYPHDQRLIVRLGDRYMILREGYTLGNYKIEDGAKVHLATPFRSTEGASTQEPFTIVISFSKQSYHYDVTSSLTVAELMDAIWAKQGIPIDRQVLTFRGIRLKEFSVLKDFMLRNDDTIVLDDCNPC